MPLLLWSFALFMGTGCAAPVAENDARLIACDNLSLPSGTTAVPGVIRFVGPIGARPARLNAAPSDARSADDFVNSIGINLHLSYFQTAYGTGWATIIKPKLLALGVRHVRDAGAVVPDDRWMETVYGRMNELAAQGLRFNLLVRLPRANEDGTVPAFARLLHYALPAVESFEGLNEHDLSRRPDWVSEVRSCQQELYTAVKGDSRTRDMPVYGPSMGRPGNASQVGDLSQWMDYGSIHPYPGGLIPLTNLADHETKVKILTGDRPLVATETGYHTAVAWTGEHPAVSEQAMGRYVPRLVLEYFAAGIIRTYLYEFIDEGTSHADREQAFGLLRANGGEKPAYASLRNLIQILKDPGPSFTTSRLDYSLTGDLTDLKTLVLQKRDGRFYLVVWQEAQSYDQSSKLEAVVADRSIGLQLATPAQMRVFNPLTSPNPARVAQGTSLALAVPDSPLIVEIQP